MEQDKLRKSMLEQFLFKQDTKQRWTNFMIYPRMIWRRCQWHTSLGDRCERAEEAGRGEEVMQIAAESANLAPTCRNSQKGVKKLLVAAAAMMRSLSTVTSPSETSLGSQQTDTVLGPTPTHEVQAFTYREQRVIKE